MPSTPAHCHCYQRQELTIHFLEHAVHLLEVTVVQEPDLRVAVILLEGHCITAQVGAKQPPCYEAGLERLQAQPYAPAKLFVTSTRPFDASPSSTPITRFLVSRATRL